MLIEPELEEALEDLRDHLSLGLGEDVSQRMIAAALHSTNVRYEILTHLQFQLYRNGR